MKLKIYTVYDNKVSAYLQPIYLRNRGEAVRAFTESVNDPKSQFFKYPSDYVIHEIGEFDDENGLITNQTWASLGSALDFKISSSQPTQ